MTARTAARRITEAEWQKLVIEYATLRGWKIAHFRPARTTTGWRTPVAVHGAGFPDLVLARPGDQPLFLELKSVTGRATRAQHDWIAALGDNARIIRPSDWDTVKELLE